MDDNKEFIKLNMLMNAINEVEEESQEEELDEESDFYAELKEAAWNILHENPDTDLENWKMMLIEQYPTEVVDALGTNPPEVFAELSDWWDSMGYDDGITDLHNRYLLTRTEPQVTIVHQEVCSVFFWCDWIIM